MSDWFKDWFNSDEYQQAYSHRDDGDALKLFKLIETYANIKRGSKVLDLACGNGRHSMLFSRYGCEVTGVDLNEKMLEIARSRSEQEDLKINFIQGDIRSFLSAEKFDIIVNLFTSFGYFQTDIENFMVFDNVSNMLNKNGFFIFDYLNKPFLINNLVSRTSNKIGDILLEQKRFIEDDRINKEIVFTGPLGQKKFFESVRLYDIEEIKRAIEGTGLKIRNIFGNYQGDAYIQDVSERIIIISGK